MDIEAIIRSVEPDTKWGKFKKIAPAILSKMDEGVKRDTILKILQREGFNLTKATFIKYLHLYRKEYGLTKKGESSGSVLQPENYNLFDQKKEDKKIFKDSTEERLGKLVI